MTIRNGHYGTMLRRMMLSLACDGDVAMHVCKRALRMYNALTDEMRERVMERKA